jgi:hypothetical protein
MWYLPFVPETCRVAWRHAVPILALRTDRANGRCDPMILVTNQRGPWTLGSEA